MLTPGGTINPESPELPEQQIFLKCFIHQVPLGQQVSLSVTALVNRLKEKLTGRRPMCGTLQTIHLSSYLQHIVTR